MKVNITEVKNQLQDVFNIYLDTNIAGDNRDRQKKLYALTETFKILNNY